MTASRVFTPPNRLAKVLIAAGGQTAREVVATANTRLESLEDQLRATVTAGVGRIMALQREGDDALRANSLALGDAALNIAEVAGAAKLPALGEAARGLRAMIDAHAGSGLWRADAVSLHIAALALLSTSDNVAAADADLILRRLHAMRRVVGVPD